jgi:hypothetical protein
MANLITVFDILPPEGGMGTPKFGEYLIRYVINVSPLAR